MSELLKGKKLLMIDDESGLLDSVAFGLSNDGCQVLTAPNGEEGLKKLQSGSIDVVICDIMMPGTNGIEVLKSIKKMDPDISVIMATGFASLETAVGALQAGAFDYVTKPYDLPHIRVVLEKAIRLKNLNDAYIQSQEQNKINSEFILSKGKELMRPGQEILNYSSALIEGSYGNLSTQQIQIIRQIETHAQQLLKIVRGISDLPRETML